MNRRQFLLNSAATTAIGPTLLRASAQPTPRRLLYVASPGVRNYTEYGGVGVLVFDGDDGHRFLRRIPTFEPGSPKAAENVKGICASAKTARLYVGTIKRMLCIDMVTEKPVWERAYEGGCDRMAISPDGSRIYMPSLEGPTWSIVDTANGEEIKRVRPDSGAHNTVASLDGRFVYLGGLKSKMMPVLDTRKLELVSSIGPFGHVIRPFTVDGKRKRAYVNVNDLLGFEVADLTTGKLLARVEVTGFKQGPVLRHGCPSHGVALSPDETEVWVADAANKRVHIFDNRKMPPVQVASLPVRGEPGWITFTLDGKYALPSTGEVIETKMRRTHALLADEMGRSVQSEKMLEVLWQDGRPVRCGDQFGVGRKR